jgi:hypothetical protein
MYAMGDAETTAVMSGASPWMHRPQAWVALLDQG